MSDEKLSALETEVAEVISVLLELDSEDNATDGQSTIKGCIDRYARQVERIGDAASEAGFPGLQDACLLLQENLAALNIRNTQITQEERDLLEEWPTLVMGYLTSYEDVNSADELIRHLQNPCWTNPLPEEFSDVLKSLLVSPELSSTQEAQTAINDITPITAVNSDDFDQIPLETSDVLTEELVNRGAVVSGEPSEDGLEEGLARLVEISELFFSEETGPEKIIHSIDRYDQQLARVGVAAETAGYVGLQELSMLLQENLSYISRDGGQY